MDEIDEGLRAQTYRELEWMRYYEFKGKQWHSRSRRRVPGWTAHTYREIFGAWPCRWMQMLTPCEPSEPLRKLVTKRDNAFKKEVKANAGQADAKVSRRGRAAGGGNGSEGAAVDGSVRHRGGQD